MALFVSENVAAEKVDAMKRFERRRDFWKTFPAIESLIAVLLLLSWLTQSLSASDYLRRNVPCGLTSGIFIFAVVNVLIALIFTLSNRQKLIVEPDIYFQYVSSSAASHGDGCSSEAAASGVCSFSAVVSESSASQNEEKTSEGKPGTDLTSITLTAGEALPMRREMIRAVSSVAETAGDVK